MPEPPKTNVRLEIAHVLLIDIVGYPLVQPMNNRAWSISSTRVVRSSDEFSRAAAAGQLKKIPTGDGMALIFMTVPSNQSSAPSKSAAF